MSLFMQLTFIQQLLLIFTTIITLVIGIYAINWALLAILSIKSREKSLDVTPLKDLPEVTIHIPLFNERQVVSRIFNACLKLDYPKEKLKIITIDDSDDGTTEIARSFEAKFPQIIKIIHRESRLGYKAGALQIALKNTISEFFIIFDADDVPAPDLLKRLIPYMYSSKDVAFVLTRTSYLNPKQSWITKAVSLILDGWGIIDQRARYTSNLLAHFTGTGVLFRRSAVQSVGGWESDTLAEDLDMSIRLQLKGWKYIYPYNLTCPGEIPSSFRLVRKQQFRWAKGCAQCFRKHYRSIMKSARLSIFQKFEALILLATYFVYPVSIIGFILSIPYSIVFPPSFFFNDYWKMIFAPIATSFSAAIYLVPIFVYGMTVLELSPKGYSDYKRLVNVIGISLIGLGTLISNSKACMEGLLNKSSPFERTEKYGIVDIDKST